MFYSFQCELCAAVTQLVLTIGLVVGGLFIAGKVLGGGEDLQDDGGCVFHSTQKDTRFKAVSLSGQALGTAVALCQSQYVPHPNMTP